MSYPLPGVIVEPQGVSTSVAITDSAGHSPTVYADSLGVSTISMPDTITARKTYYLPGEGPWKITPTANGEVTQATTLTLEGAEVATVTVGSAFTPAQWAQFGAYAPLARVAAATLQAWGHSYVFGIAASDQGKTFPQIVAESLGLPLANRAVSGETLAYQAGGLASWVGILQGITRPGLGAVAGSGATATATPGFGGPGGVFLNMYGINDLNSFGNTAAAMGGFKHCLRMLVSRQRAGVIFEDTDASFTFDGNWATTTGSTTENSGTTFHYTATNGATFTVTTPADFPGGTIALGITSRGASGAVYTATLGGVTLATLDTTNPEASAYIGCVMRLPNIPAGVQTIHFSVASVATLTEVDYWQWEPPASDPTCPLVYLLTQPYPVDYSAYGNTPPGPPTNAGVDVINTIISAIAAEFDSRVVVVDLSSMNAVAAYFSADNLHPNDNGHHKIASLVEAAAANLRVIYSPSSVGADAVWQLPTFTGTWANLGSGWSTAAYRKDASGIVHLKGQVVGGTIPSSVFTLPVGYRPGEYQTFGTVAGGTFAEVQVDITGNVNVENGSAGWTSLNGITFLAEK